MGGIRVLAPGPDATEVAWQLLRVRKQLHLSQAQLGAQLGLSRGTVGRWERGERGPPLYLPAALRLILAQALGLPAALPADTLEAARGALLRIELDAAAGTLSEAHRAALVDGLARALAALGAQTAADAARVA